MNPTKGLRTIDCAQLFLFFATILEILFVYLSGNEWTSANVVIAILIAVFSISSALLEVSGVWTLRKVNLNFASARVVVVIYLFIAIAVVISEAFKFTLTGWMIAIYLMYCYRLVARLLVVLNVTDGTNKIVNIQDRNLVKKGKRIKKCFLIITIMIILCYFYAVAIETYDLFKDKSQLLETTLYIVLTVGLVIKLAINVQYLTYINSAYRIFKVQ